MFVCLEPCYTVDQYLNVTKYQIFNLLDAVEGENCNWQWKDFLTYILEHPV